MKKELWRKSSALLIAFICLSGLTGCSGATGARGVKGEDPTGRGIRLIAGAIIAVVVFHDMLKD